MTHYQLFLEQEKAGEVRNFFEYTESDFLAIIEFTIYSIGIILSRLGKEDVFEDFLSKITQKIHKQPVCHLFPGQIGIKAVKACEADCGCEIPYHF